MRKSVTTEAATAARREPDRHRAVYYNYRYFLPYAPQWGTEEFCNRRLEELLGFCRQGKIDAVQFFVNTTPGTYYMPARSAAEQEHWAVWMKDEVAPALRKIGVSYQLNLQMLLGAHSSGLDMRDEYGWGFLVNQYGQETLGCACPIDLDFRRIMGEMLRLWASTGPDIVWIDDDFRLHNHGLGPDELDFYCFCQRHLDLFAQREGRRHEREELLAEVLRPGKPSPLRGRWLDLLSESMTETAAWIRQQVQGASPKTRLAQMTSAPDVHSAEGRDWKAFLTALCGDGQPIIRPCSGIYTGTVAPIKQHTVTYRFMCHSIAVVEQALGPGVAEYGPELENTRFTTWCKSVRNTEHILVLGQLLGCPEITLSMSDLDGSPLSEEPTNLSVLRDNKPRLQALAEVGLRQWNQAGLALISDPDAARKVQVSTGAKMQDLGLLRQWEDVLLQMGIPAFYASPRQAADGDAVVALEGYTVWCLSDSELERVLARSVLLDGDAAWVLQQRGFGRHIGVRIGERGGHGLHAEIYSRGVLPDVGQIRVPNRGRVWYEMEAVGATVLSRFIDPMYRLHTGSAIFENELGGRVAVYSGVGDAQGTFASHARLRWLHALLRWLSRESFCVLPLIPHHGLTVVRINGNQTMLAFVNLGADAVENLKVRLSGSFTNLKVLDKSGVWKHVEFIRHRTKGVLSIPCRLETFEWLTALLS